MLVTNIIVHDAISLIIANLIVDNRLAYQKHECAPRNVFNKLPRASYIAAMSAHPHFLASLMNLTALCHGAAMLSLYLNQ